MGIVEVTYYQAVCDACEFNITEEGGGGEYSAWADSGTPFEHASEAGLGIGGTGDKPALTLCADCANRYFKELGEEETEALLDGDKLAEEAVRVYAKSALAAKSADREVTDGND